MAFVAIAGRSSLEASQRIAPSLFDADRIFWGYDESIWGLYGVRGQPVTVLVESGEVVEAWFGARSESEIRSLLDGILDAA